MILEDLSTFEPILMEKNKARPGVLMTVGGVFQRAETKNANSRIYPKKLWTKLLSSKDLKSRLKSRAMFGLLGHPNSNSTDPEKISHVVTKNELREDNSIYGEADILDTPTGRIAATLLKAGCALGVSSRGEGSVEEKGDTSIVLDDFRLETYDFVINPSTSKAYPKVIKQSEEQVAEAIKELVDSELPKDQREAVLRESLDILNTLDSEVSESIPALCRRITEEIQGTSVKNVNSNEERSTMKVDKPEGLTADLVIWHQDKVSEAVNEAKEEFSKKLEEKDSEVDDAQREVRVLQKRLSAAEDIINSFQGKISELKSKKNESSSSRYNTLKVRYNAAVELLDEALLRLPEIKSFRNRSEALEKLFQASLDKIQEDRVEVTVEECLSRVPVEMRSTIKPMFEDCKTPEQVAKIFKGIVATNRVSSDEPLPHKGMNENSKNVLDLNESDSAHMSFVEKLDKRLARAV